CPLFPLLGIGDGRRDPIAGIALIGLASHIHLEPVVIGAQKDPLVGDPASLGAKVIGLHCHANYQWTCCGREDRGMQSGDQYRQRQTWSGWSSTLSGFTWPTAPCRGQGSEDARAGPGNLATPGGWL